MRRPEAQLVACTAELLPLLLLTPAAVVVVSDAAGRSRTKPGTLGSPGNCLALAEPGRHAPVADGCTVTALTGTAEIEGAVAVAVLSGATSAVWAGKGRWLVRTVHAMEVVCNQNQWVFVGLVALVQTLVAQTAAEVALTPAAAEKAVPALTSAVEPRNAKATLDTSPLAAAAAAAASLAVLVVLQYATLPAQWTPPADTAAAMHFSASSTGAVFAPAAQRPPPAAHLHRPDCAPAPAFVSMPEAATAILRPADDDGELLLLSCVQPFRPFWPRRSFRTARHAPWGRAVRTRRDDALGSADHTAVAEAVTARLHPLLMVLLRGVCVCLHGQC